MRASRSLRYAALVVAAASWGSAGALIKFALGSWPPLTLLVVQLAAANLVLWTILLIRGYRRPVRLWRVLLLGVFEPGLAYALLTIGLLWTSAANAAVISALESFFVIVLAAVFLRERITARTGLGLAAALLGVLVLEWAGGVDGFHGGDVLVAAAILSAAVYVIIARTVAPDEDALTLTAHQFLAGLILTLPFAATRWANGGEAALAPHPLSSWIAALAVGVIGYGASFVLYNYAIASTSAGLSSMIINLMPVFGLVAAWIVLGEGIAGWQWLGAALVLSSILIFPKESEALA